MAFYCYSKLLVDCLVIHLINSFLVVGLAWNPETRVVWYISILGLLSSLEMGIGVIVEVTTCIYLKSVCVVKRKTIRWRDMGPFEISSTIVGVSVIVTGLLATYAGDFIFYLIMSTAFFDAHILYISLLCCSLVFSLEEFKEQAKKMTKVTSSAGYATGSSVGTGKKQSSL
jgi:hypothetical protein